MLRGTASGATPSPIESIDAIERQGNRMLRLVMNLLAESRIEADANRVASVGAFDVAALMHEVAGDFHLDGERIHVEVGAGTRARCDRGEGRRHAGQPLDNALKYSEPATSVTLPPRSRVTR